MSALSKCPRCKTQFAHAGGSECGICRVELHEVPVLCILNKDGKILAYGVSDSLKNKLSCDDFSFATIPANAIRRHIEKQTSGGQQ